MKIRNLASTCFLMIAFVLLFQSCKDSCQIVDSYMAYDPVYISYEDLRSPVIFEEARLMQTPGKIYKYNNFILINELNEGLHLLDNTDPTSPNAIGFIKIPGNTEMAVKNGHLYANSFVDLVVIDLSNPLLPAEVGRLEDIFPQRTYPNGLAFENPEGVITAFNLVEKTETRNVDCGSGFGRYEGFSEVTPGLVDFGDLSTTSLDNAGNPGRNDDVSGGTGGSLARFTIVGNYLYHVDHEDMHLFDISSSANPVKWMDIRLGWGIETIFPYEGYLFIGSQSGMHIYDNTNPSNPEFVSTYEHVTSCDPVVVEGQYAYVTLRSGNPCQNFINQLDVVDISNIHNPTRLKSYQMHNPHGLGIDNGVLFLCEADAGLKVFDAGDPMQIDVNQLDHVQNIHAFDVIPQQHLLLLIGDDGFYQYDYTNPANLQYLSKIAVN